jgi:hypothetical protein
VIRAGIRSLVGLLVAACVIALVPPQAFAAQKAGGTTNPSAVPAALAPLSPYVTISKGGYGLHAPQNVLRRVDPSALAALRAYQSSVKKYFRSGQLSMSADGVGVVASSGERITPMKTWHGSHGFIETHWYGIEVGLDAYLVSKVSSGAFLGSGIAGLAALLGGGPYAGAIAAVLAILGAEVQFCQHSSGWSYLYWLGSIVPGAFICNPF